MGDSRGSSDIRIPPVTFEVNLLHRRPTPCGIGKDLNQPSSSEKRHILKPSTSRFPRARADTSWKWNQETAPSGLSL